MSASPVLEQSPRQVVAGLYERHYDRVFGYCLYKLGDRQEAEDAAQTTFLWALRGLERGIEPRMEANWLFTIAQNACRARIRTRGRRRAREVLSDPQVLQGIAPGRPGARDELVGLDKALADIPELQRRAILLREWRGLSYKEIAAELGLTDAAVETLIFRARRSLATRLEHPDVMRTKRSKALAAINLGPLASMFKTILGVGSGAKAGLAVTAAASLAIGLGVPGDTEKAPARPVRSVPATVASVSPAQPAKRPARHVAAQAKPKPGPKHQATSQAAEDPSSAPDAPVVIPPAVDLPATLAPVEETLEPVRATVEKVVETVQATLPVETQLETP